MDKVTRIYSEGKTALIKWIEDNFDQIEEFIFTAHLKDTTMTIYDCYSYFNACAINSIQNDTINELSHNGEFVNKE